MTEPLSVSSLEALLESANLLHSSLNLDDLLKHLLRSVMGRLLISKGLIAVFEDGQMRHALVRGLPKLSVGEVFDEEAARSCGIDLILPIGNQENPEGLLAIGRPLNKTVDREDLDFLRALLGIAASGISNARAHAETRLLNEALDQKVQELKTLLDLVRGLTSSLEPDEVAQLLTLTLTGRWAIRKYALIAWKKGHPPVLRLRGMELDQLAKYQSWEQEILEMREAVRVADLHESPLKDLLRSAQAEVIFPVVAGDNSTGGLVILGPRPGNLSYAESDLEFGTGLVAQAAVAFENSWYFREAIEKKKVEQELALAASIQENLFPSSMPAIPPFDLAAHNRPARQCGGDYYDILPRCDADGKLKNYLICVADVSGKGLPASLLMSNIQATLRALLGRIDSLTDLAALTNELLYASTPSNKYVTAILLDFDPQAGRARFVNAGHTDCLLLRDDGEAIWLKATGTPLGLLPDMPYEERFVEFRPGDLIALFSDGVTEAQDEQENEYGDERIANFLRPLANEPARAIVNKVFEEIDRFAGTAPQYDDITLFVIKWPS
ncbi:MAG: SpoIIE family protein phosphatase [Acidobacteriota bacterium]|nr:MAG: SpoIIE family protein phosphatase [Acidobacteriota bacterium]